MEKLKDYLDIFKLKSEQKRFVFGQVIYSDASKEEANSFLRSELPKAIFVEGDLESVGDNSTIIEAIESGKIVVANVSQKINEPLLKYLLTIYKGEPGLDYKKISKSSIIFLINADSLDNFQSGGLELYTCNLQ